MADKPSHNAKIIGVGDSVSFSNEAMSDTGDGYTWQTSTLTKSIWDPEQTMVVEVDSGGGYGVVSAANYTLDYVVGKVTFASDQTGNSVRISGYYHPRYTIAQARAASMAVSRKPNDGNRFGDGGQRRKYGRLDCGSEITILDENMDPIDGGGGSEDSILDMILAAKRTCLEINPDRDNSRFFRFWCRFYSQGQELANDSISTSTLSASGTNITPTMSTQPRNLWSYRV